MGVGDGIWYICFCFGFWGPFFVIVLVAIVWMVLRVLQSV
jgi:hypothetical protein